ncbi:MAG: DUF1059 domain-containing protein [Candidatus Zixiibacteriota bacterium]
MGNKTYKQISCQDFGVDCGFMVRPETDEEVMRVAADHACRLHHKCESSPYIEKKVKSLIKEVTI